jgi:hypothetical protein
MSTPGATVSSPRAASTWQVHLRLPCLWRINRNLTSWSANCGAAGWCAAQSMPVNCVSDRSVLAAGAGAREGPSGASGWEVVFHGGQLLRPIAVAICAGAHMAPADPLRSSLSVRELGEDTRGTCVGGALFPRG